MLTYTAFKLFKFSELFILLIFVYLYGSYQLIILHAQFIVLLLNIFLIDH